MMKLQIRHEHCMLSDILEVATENWNILAHWPTEFQVVFPTLECNLNMPIVGISPKYPFRT